MAEFSFDLTWVAITAIIVTAFLVAPKIVQKTSKFEQENYKKRHNLQNAYIKDLEEDNEALKKDVVSLKRSAAQKERGPSVEGEVSELDNILPDLVSEFAPFAPKWIQPFLSDKGAQKWIIDYLQKNPDKAKDWFGKFIKSKNSKQNVEKEEDRLSV